MKKLLIWDIDGTLITGGVGKKAMENAFKSIYNIENALSQIKMAGMLDNYILKSAFDKHNLDFSENNKSNFLKTYLKILENDIINFENLPQATPGVYNLFERITFNNGYCNALGTGNIEEGGRLKLKGANLNHHFKVGGFCNDNFTERWEVIKDAIDNSKKFYNINFSNNDIFIIGDTPFDIACGKKLNVKTVGIATGRYSTEELLSYNCDFVFKDLSDTDSFINQLN